MAGRYAATEEPTYKREHLKGQTQALEDLAIELLARGLSVRDIEDAFRDEGGRLLLSRTAVSEIGARLWADYQEFSRDLSEYDITYLPLVAGPLTCGLADSALQKLPGAARQASYCTGSPRWTVRGGRCARSGRPFNPFR